MNHIKASKTELTIIRNRAIVKDMGVQIGIDYTAAIHQSAGIGRYTRELVKTLAELPRNSFDPQFHLFAADIEADFGPPLPDFNFQWHPTRLTKRWLNRLWYRFRLPLPVEYWTGPLDLFHASDFVLPPVKKGTRTIVTIHDLSFVREPASIMPGMSTYLNKWVPHSVRQADHVIAVSEATRQDLIEIYRTPAEKITVLYHGVTAEFQPILDLTRLRTVRQKYDLGERPFVLSVGTIQPRKNFQRLIQAFAQIDNRFDLVIAGAAGWHFETIYNEVIEQRLSDRVYFPGFVADEDLPALYGAATVFIYPSLYEGFGLPVLEAMACGRPVITSNQSALPEVVGQAGLMVNPRDVTDIAAALHQLLGDTTLQQSLAKASLARARNFTWPTMVKDLIKLYQQVLAKD